MNSVHFGLEWLKLIFVNLIDCIALIRAYVIEIFLLIGIEQSAGVASLQLLRICWIPASKLLQIEIYIFRIKQL